MTEKTFKKWFSIKRFGKKILEEFDYIFPQNKETFLYYKKLGIKKLRFLGNLKFISSPNDKLKEIKRKFLKIKIFCVQPALIIMRKKFLLIYTLN